MKTRLTLLLLCLFLFSCNKNSYPETAIFIQILNSAEGETAEPESKTLDFNELGLKLKIEFELYTSGTKKYIHKVTVHQLAKSKTRFNEIYFDPLSYENGKAYYQGGGIRFSKESLFKYQSTVKLFEISDDGSTISWKKEPEATEGANAVPEINSLADNPAYLTSINSPSKENTLAALALFNNPDVKNNFDGKDKLLQHLDPPFFEPIKQLETDYKNGQPDFKTHIEDRHKALKDLKTNGTMPNEKISQLDKLNALLDKVPFP